MGTTRSKVSYLCDCGEDYGSCEKPSYFLMEYSRSCDVGRIYHKLHANLPDSKLEYLGCFGDNGLHALSNLLRCINDDEQWTEQDKEDVKKL